MSSSTFTINGVKCRARDDEIDLRAAGFLKTSIPPELLNHPQIKTILLYHEDVPEFLQSIVDNLGAQLSINVFVDNNNKCCEIKTDELGLIGLDVRCNAVNVVGVIAACKRKLRRLVLRNYECGSLDGLDRTTVSDVEELVIASDDTLSVNVGYYRLFPDEKDFPEISFQNITLKTSTDPITELDTTSQCKTISVEGMTNLQRLLLCGKRKKILPTGMDQLNNLQELFIFDDPIGDDFELSDKLKLRKVMLYNCGLKVLPLAITAMEELEVLELYHNNFQNQLLSLDKLVKLKRLVIFRCFLNAYRVGLRKLTNLETLHLGWNRELGQQSFSIPSSRNLKYLDMRYCGLKKLPGGLEHCVNLEVLSLQYNRELGQQSFSIPSSRNLKHLDMRHCGLKKLPGGLEHCVNLEVLSLQYNIELGQQSFSIPSSTNLKHLNMRNCGLKKLPGGLEHCVNLEVLSLQDNSELGQQSFSIPSSTNLKQLNMSNCGLKKLPGGLEHCVNLEVLNLQDNRDLGQQSFSIPSLTNLRHLNMKYCGLKKVPDSLENNIGLINCDMSFNKLKEFPECVANLIETGTNFHLTGNVLEKPPQVICNNGRSILNYFKSIAKFGEAHSKRLRVVVIGNSGAGKTSLVNGLLMGESRPTDEDERTEGIEIRKWYPDPENEDLELEIWDFGGHMEYQSVSHYFFEKHSLFLLAVDVSEYETTDESYDENAGKWIDELKSIVRRPVIMVTATKSDLVEDSVVNDRCQDMLKRINKQEKRDVDSIKSDLENLDENDSSNTCTKEKLNSLTAERPVLPKEIVLTSDEKDKSANGETGIVVTSAGRRRRIGGYEGLNVSNLRQELVRTGNNMNLFPHLETKLPLLWVEIEKLLPALREEMKNKNLTKYLTFEELEKWLCQHLEMFNEVVEKKETLHAVILYLVKLGKVLHFERVKQLKDLIFPDPQWLIMLVKEVVHHELESHLKFREEFQACNMDAEMFEKEKRDLVEKGMLSESLLRCIWFDAVPKLPVFKKIAALLDHFDVGYKMTVKEAEFEGKNPSENYTFIPALMPKDSPVDIKRLWPTTALENEIEMSSQYSIYSTFPVGLFERQMVRSHRCSNYRIQWNQGFFGITMEEQEKVTFYVTKQNKKIEFTARISNNGKINGLWMVVLRFHQIFADMVQELWPRLRYEIRHRCPGCRKYHHKMTSKDDNKELFCEDPHIMDFVKKELIIPPPEVVKKFQEINGASTTSAGVSSPVMVSDIPYLVIQYICRLLNVESTVGDDYRTLAGMLGMKTTDIWLLSQNANPTNEVLKWWVPQNSATVQKFREILKEMRRDDVLAVLDGKKQSEYQTDEEIQPPQKKTKLDDNPDQG